jgi:hypothetical protein
MEFAISSGFINCSVPFAVSHENTSALYMSGYINVTLFPAIPLKVRYLGESIGLSDVV